MKKKTAMIAASVTMVAFLSMPLIIRPKGFDGHNESFVNHYLRGVGHIADQAGAESISLAIRHRVEGIPSNRELLQFVVLSAAEAEFLSDAAFDGYPSRSSFLACRTDLKNGILRVEIDRGSGAWFEAYLGKALSRYRGHP